MQVVVVLVQSIHRDVGMVQIYGGSLVKEDVIEIGVVVGPPPECWGGKVNTPVGDALHFVSLGQTLSLLWPRF